MISKVNITKTKCIICKVTGHKRLMYQESFLEYLKCADKVFLHIVYNTHLPCEPHSFK